MERSSVPPIGMETRECPCAGEGARRENSAEGKDECEDAGLGLLCRQLSNESAHLAPYGLLEAPHSVPTSPLYHGRSGQLHSGQLHSGQLHSGSFDLKQSLLPCGVPEHHVGVFDQSALRPASWWKQLLEFMGPGWLMSVAYIDPGNLEADLQSGAQFGYSLLWALFVATAMGLGMQLIAARLGCATRRHLAEHCKEHYPRKVRIFLWVMTELAIVGSDIQEVIGSSIGLKLLFGLPLAGGVVITAIAAFGFLFLERLGTRPLELFFGALILVLACSMAGLFSVIKPDYEEMLDGFLPPRMPPSAVRNVVGMLGCVIMPHNLFLHSALVQSRIIPPGEEANAIYFFTVESSAAIFTSLLINMSVVAIFAKGFFGTRAADDIGLGSAGHYLGGQYGDFMRVIWALGLCAAGQSSTMTGAYAGQWVMQGYLQLQVKSWKRAIITRSMALLPTLLVAIHFGGGREGLDELNEFLNLVQSIVLPFAVVPLLTFVGSRSIMGDLVLPRGYLVAGWLGASLIMVANLYLMFEESGLGYSSGGSSAEEAWTRAGMACVLVLYVCVILYVAWLPRSALKGPGE